MAFVWHMCGRHSDVELKKPACFYRRAFCAGRLCTGNKNTPLALQRNGGCFAMGHV